MGFLSRLADYGRLGASVGGRYLAVKVFKFGTKIPIKNFKLYALFATIRDKKKYFSTFSVYVDGEKNHI